jgi:hypothetical protein
MVLFSDWVQPRLVDEMDLFPLREATSSTKMWWPREALRIALPTHLNFCR